MPNFFRSRFFIIGLSILTVIFITAVVIRILLPPEPSVPLSTLSSTNSDGSTTTFGSVTLTAQLFSMPNSLPIYEVTLSDTVSTTNTLVQSLNLTAAQTPGVWESETYLLVQDQYSKQLTLLLKNQLETTAPTTTSEAATTVAQQFISELGLNNYIPLPALVKEQPFEAEQEYGSSGLANATSETIFAVPFSVDVSGYPLYLNASRNVPLKVMVEKSGAVNTVLFEPNIPIMKQLGLKTLLSPQEAVEGLTQGRGSIITASSESNVTELSLASITQLNLSEVILEYRVDSELQLAYPFFRFSGSATQADRQLHIELLTPAVALSQ